MLWYVPEMRTEKFEARDDDELRELINKKYSSYKSSHSETQELYNGIYEIKEI